MSDRDERLPISKLDLSATDLHDSDIFLISELSGGKWYSKLSKIELIKKYVSADLDISISNYCQNLSAGIVSDHIDNINTTIGYFSSDLTSLSSTVLSIYNKTPDLIWDDDNVYADKKWVNSSIATNTSYFRGTYNSFAVLSTVSAYNNDYAFLCSLIKPGTTSEYVEYARYKFLSNDLCSLGWTFEYTLNNSSYTANQWNSINSGITPSLVNKLKSINFETWNFITLDGETIPKKIAINGKIYSITFTKIPNRDDLYVWSDVSGYAYDDKATVYAVTKSEDYEFDKWIRNDREEYYLSTWSFNISDDVELSAYFKDTTKHLIMKSKSGERYSFDIISEVTPYGLLKYVDEYLNVLEPYSDIPDLGNKDNLVEVIDKKDLVSIDTHAFYECESLSSINIPNIKTIGLQAFYNCSNLSSIIIPESNEYFSTLDNHSILMNKNKTKVIWGSIPCSENVVLSDSVLSIDIGAFFSCSNLSSIECQNVETIDDSAFCDCSSLTTINCPNVGSIGWQAFYNCSNLSSLIISSATKVPSVDDSSFDECPKPVSVYVKDDEMVSEFSNADVWKELKDGGQVVFYKV